jgi:hypothetical protein
MRVARILSVIVATFISLPAYSASENTPEHSSIRPGAVREGFYTSLTTGELFFTGNDRLNYRDGWLIGLKAGYDIWKYIGFEGIFKFSGHSTTSSAVSIGQVATSFFVYQMLGQLKGAYPVTQRFHIDAGIGGGLWYSNPRMGTQAGRSEFYGELGCEYFFRTRGMSMGIDPSIGAVTNLKSAIVQLTGFFRYTF